MGSRGIRWDHAGCMALAAQAFVEAACSHACSAPPSCHPCTHESLRTPRTWQCTFLTSASRGLGRRGSRESGCAIGSRHTQRRRTYAAKEFAGGPACQRAAHRCRPVHTPRLEHAHTTSGFRHKHAHMTQKGGGGGGMHGRAHALALNTMRPDSLRSVSQQLHPCRPWACRQT